MKSFVFLVVFLSFSLFFGNINADTLSNEAKLRGINDTCQSYLSQIESSYGLKGINLTFAHPIDPSFHPSLHTTTQKFNNGSSFFAATLSPDNEFCYLSMIKFTIVNNQSCDEIIQVRLNEDPSLLINQYADGSYTHITPKSSENQSILVSTGDSSCTMTESQMLWPGK